RLRTTSRSLTIPATVRPSSVETTTAPMLCSPSRVSSSVTVASGRIVTTSAPLRRITSEIRILHDTTLCVRSHPAGEVVPPGTGNVRWPPPVGHLCRPGGHGADRSERCGQGRTGRERGQQPVVLSPGEHPGPRLGATLLSHGGERGDVLGERVWEIGRAHV